MAGAPIYAVDVPELVLAFYLDRPVVTLSPDEEFQSHGRTAPIRYLVVADRALPQWSDHRPIVKIATGSVNGRRFSVLLSGAP